MSIKTKELTARQEKAAIAIASGEPIGEIATKTKIPVRTLFEWRQQPQFQALVRERRSALFDAIVGSLVDRALDGARVLHEIVLNTEASPGVRVSASRALLDIAFRGFELGELTSRLEALEQQAIDASASPQIGGERR